MQSRPDKDLLYEPCSAAAPKCARARQWVLEWSEPGKEPEATATQPSLPSSVHAPSESHQVARYEAGGGLAQGIACTSASQAAFGARVQEAEAAAPLPTLAQRAFPARANPMAVAASSAAGVDVSPPSVLLRHPDRGTGASVGLSCLLCPFSLGFGVPAPCMAPSFPATAVSTAALLNSLGGLRALLVSRVAPCPCKVCALSAVTGRGVAAGSARAPGAGSLAAKPPLVIRGGALLAGVSARSPPHPSRAAPHAPTAVLQAERAPPCRMAFNRVNVRVSGPPQQQGRTPQQMLFCRARLLPRGARAAKAREPGGDRPARRALARQLWRLPRRHAQLPRVEAGCGGPHAVCRSCT